MNGERIAARLNNRPRRLPWDQAEFLRFLDDGQLAAGEPDRLLINAVDPVAALCRRENQPHLFGGPFSRICHLSLPKHTLIVH